MHRRSLVIRPARSLAALALAAIVISLAACSSGSTPAPSAGASPSAAGSGGGLPVVRVVRVPERRRLRLAEPGDRHPAQGRPRLHPERPVRPVLLRPAAGLLPRRGSRRHLRERDRPEYLIRKTGLGSVDISLADGTSLIPAASQGIPVKYVATIYARFPNVVFADAASGITTAADLKGRKIGIPGRYGSGWIMLQALLSSAELTPEDVTIVEYPDFGQLAGVEQGAVDAATGFANNEPVRLEATGKTATILGIDDIVPLPGNGLIVGTSTLGSKHDALAAFVAATLRAMAEIKEDPELGWDAAVAAVPELASDPTTPVALQKAVLRRHDRHVVRRRDRERGTRCDLVGRLDCVDRLPVVAPRGPCAQPCHGRPARHDRAPAAGQLSDRRRRSLGNCGLALLGEHRRHRRLGPSPTGAPGQDELGRRGVRRWSAPASSSRRRSSPASRPASPGRR